VHKCYFNVLLWIASADFDSSIFTRKCQKIKVCCASFSEGASWQLKWSFMLAGLTSYCFWSCWFSHLFSSCRWHNSNIRLPHIVIVLSVYIYIYMYVYICHIWKPHFIKTVFSIYLCKLFAISVLYAFRNFDFLIPDAPELIANFLDGEQDASCKRNAFMMLIHADQVTLVHACWNLMVLCNFFIINYCVLSWLKAMTVFM